MNIFEKCYDRLFQKTLFIAQRVIKFRVPEIKNRIEDIPVILKEHKVTHPLVVSDKIVSTLPRFIDLAEELKLKGFEFNLFTDIKPDPTFEEIDSIVKVYKENNCDSIIAVGGGSTIDAAKAMGLLVTYPNKKLNNFRGMLKVHKSLPLFIALPTTAGTGSEATVASVVTNQENGDKFAINDPHLIPHYAILDDTFLDQLPKQVIGTTGMDAFTHALEAYIGKSSTKFTREMSIKSIKLIKDNLYPFYENNKNDETRKKMLEASFYAGVSFTRAYVGYVHALAHAVGGTYHKAHGYCIAILLPYVLEAFGKSAYKKLAEVSDAMELVNISCQDEEKAKAVLSWIKEMNEKMNIPSSFEGLIEDKDLDNLARHAAKEANPWYPVPKLFSWKKLKDILIRSNGK